MYSWIGLRVESVGNLIILAAALFSVLTPELSGADAGLSLTYALQVTTYILIRYLIGVKGAL